MGRASAPGGWQMFAIISLYMFLLSLCACVLAVCKVLAR
jgi:hypothetical protein